MTPTIAHNIPKLYLIKGLRWFLLIMPILVLFFQDNGLTMMEILLLQSIFSIGMIVLEIPSGYFSDVVGRRTTMIIGSTLTFLAFLIYCVAHDFWTFLLAELVLGFGGSFISGTDSALMYDSLVQLDREQEYTRIEGRMLSIGNFSEATASIIAGFLAEISLRAPLYAETAVVFLAIPIAFSLIEPDRTAFDTSSGKFKGILRIVKFALHDLPPLKWLILYSALVGASTLTMVWFIQPYFKLVELPLAMFGIAWAALNFSVGIFSLLAYQIERALGRRLSTFMLIVLSIIGYLLVASIQAIWAIVFIFIFYFVRGVGTPIFRTYINQLVTSDRRATVLSVKNMVGRLIFAVIGPFIGWLADIYPLSTALLASATIFWVAGIILLWFLFRAERTSLQPL